MDRGRLEGVFVFMGMREESSVEEREIGLAAAFA
jgi:hypothetical protein